MLKQEIASKNCGMLIALAEFWRWELPGELGLFIIRVIAVA